MAEGEDGQEEENESDGDELELKCGANDVV